MWHVFGTRLGAHFAIFRYFQYSTFPTGCQGKQRGSPAPSAAGLNGWRHLRCGLQSQLGAHNESLASVAQKFLGDLKGGTCGHRLRRGLNGWRHLRCGLQSQLGAHSESLASVAGKFFGDLKGAFFKKPPFSRLLLAFLFDSFFFAPTSTKKKRVWKLIKQRKEYLFVEAYRPTKREGNPLP